MKYSIVIRTYNEERHLGAALEAIKNQKTEAFTVELIVVDSGSEDSTVGIAGDYGCRVLHISKDDFTFGRSLNIGCAAATGEYLVFISGHCIPANDAWLTNLVRPLVENQCVYTYGRQQGDKNSKFSEHQLLKKYYPGTSQVPQQGYFCNNANAALKRDVWEINQFNEELTGLEDMELAKRLVKNGYEIGYVAEAPVLHVHEESWIKVHRRYEREAIALQRIMPEVHVSFMDFLRYAASAILLDMGAALDQKVLLRSFLEIVLFRFAQFWGAYQGNHERRMLSREMKEKYFFPK